MKKVCPRCGVGGQWVVKNGFSRGRQRWLCSDCGLTFFCGKRRYMTLMDRRLAMVYYMILWDFNEAGRIARISHTTMRRWWKQAMWNPKTQMIEWQNSQEVDWDTT